MTKKARGESLPSVSSQAMQVLRDPSLSLGATKKRGVRGDMKGKRSGRQKKGIEETKRGRSGRHEREALGATKKRGVRGDKKGARGDKKGRCSG